MGGTRLSSERAREIFEHYWRLSVAFHLHQTRRSTATRISRLVGAAHGVHPRTVRDIATRRTWRHALPTMPGEEEPGLAESVRRMRALDPFLFLDAALY